MKSLRKAECTELSGLVCGDYPDTTAYLVSVKSIKQNEIYFASFSIQFDLCLTLMCFAPFCYLDFDTYRYFVIIHEVNQILLNIWNKECDKYC